MIQEPGLHGLQLGCRASGSGLRVWALGLRLETQAMQPTTNLLVPASCLTRE